MSLNLREHQLEIVDKLWRGFEEGHQSQLVYAPTGAGKTIIALSLLTEMKNQGKKAAMVMDRIVLVDQTSVRLNEYDIPHGILQSQHWRYRPNEPIQVCSVQTLARRKTPFITDMMIIDEAHQKSEYVTNYIKNNPQVKIVGLTATPFTKGLNDLYTKVVSSATTDDLINKGWLCPVRVYIAKEIDMTGAKKDSFGEWKASEASERGIKIVGDVVEEWRKKTMEIFGRPRKTVVFSAGVDHGRALAKQFQDAGFNFISLSYKEDDEFKKAVIDEFAKPDTDIHGLIATDILTKGFDVPDVVIGVSARPFSKSLSSHIQQIGRVMRSHPSKEFAIWLDHSGNYLRFRDNWDDVYVNGVDSLPEGGSEKTKKEPTEREKKQSKCPACGVLWTFPTDTCGSCGHTREKINMVHSVSGELEELNTANKKLNIDNQAFYSQLIWYTRMKGYKEGFAAVKYKEKFGVFPRGLHTRPEPLTPETLNWLKSRAIAYAKGKNK